MKPTLLPVVPAKRGNCPACDRTNLVILLHTSSTVHILVEHVDNNGQRCSNSFGLPAAIHDAQPRATSYTQVRNFAGHSAAMLGKATHRPVVSNTLVYAPNCTGPAQCGGQCPRCKEAAYGKA